MRLFLVLSLTCLISGCMGDTTPQSTTTTVSTLRNPQDVAIISSTNYLQSLQEFAAAGCGGVRVNGSEAVPSCPGCFDVTLQYECNSTDLSGGRELRKAKVRFEDGKVTAFEGMKVGRICLQDRDCLPTKPQEGVEFSCDNGVCTINSLTNQASMYCLSKGYNIISRSESNGGTYNVCVFPNGNECEEWQYLYGNCDPSSGNLTSCLGYPAGQLCTTDYIPVCAKHIISGNESDIQWVDFNNPCSACTTQTKDKRPKGYVMGTCPPTTSTTLGIKSFMDAAAQYCEQMGYSFRIRKYLSGNEYGVCVFGVDDECDAQDYFHGRCKPKNPN